MEFQSAVSSLLSSLVKRIILVFCFPISLLAQNPVVPVLNTLMPDVVRDAGENQLSIDLSGHFGVEEIQDQAIRLTAEWRYLDGSPGLAYFDFLLFRDRTPITTTNFLGYVNRGDYENMVIHRWVRDFVIQGGGFTITQGDAGPEFDQVATQAPILNEFGVSNTFGTISMAKLGGDPNSATSQWFISTAPNSDNLDFQNGGFTVFGRVSRETMQNVMDLNHGVEFSPYNLGGAFSGTPLVTGTVNENFTAERFFRFSSAAEIALPEGQAGVDSTLVYSLIENDGGGSVSGQIVGETLEIDYTDWPLSGRRLLTVQALDSVGNEVLDSFRVDDFTTYQEWKESQFSEIDLTNDEVSGPGADSDGDGVSNLILYVNGLKAGGDKLGQIEAPFLIFGGQSPTEIHQRIAIGLTDVDFSLEYSQTAEDWQPVEGVSPRVQESDEYDLVIFNLPAGAQTETKGFYRIRFSTTI